MAKGKRVSNKPGGKPGRRSGKTQARHRHNLRVRRRVARSKRGPVASVVVPRSVPGPKRTSILGRIAAPIKRFFRGR